MCAELSASWELRRDPEGLTYFYNTEAAVASRQHPSDESYRNRYYEHK